LEFAGVAGMKEYPSAQSSHQRKRPQIQLRVHQLRYTTAKPHHQK
jgi:hypothetical protein